MLLQQFWDQIVNIPRVVLYVTISRLKIFITVFSFLCVKANSKEICEEICFPSFQKTANVTSFIEIKG